MSNQDLSTQPVSAELTPAQRFTQKVLAIYAEGTTKDIAITDYQKRLISGYFEAMDVSIKKAEDRRKKAYKPDPLPIQWLNINMDDVARLSVKIARLGLDSYQKNHINFIPFKDNNAGCYSMGFIKGYVGLEYEARRYALEMPADVVTELIYSNDSFRAFKKDYTNKVEAYEFIQGDIFALDRELKGGFYYYQYDDPTKNKLFTLTLAQIIKRKPKTASVEFWGGEKDVWKDGKKTNQKEEVEGWLEEMAIKTIKRAAYNGIMIDPQKIDDNYQWMKQREQQFSDIGLDAIIDSEANNNFIDIQTPTEIESGIELNMFDRPIEYEIQEETEQEIAEKIEQETESFPESLPDATATVKLEF